MAEIKPFQALRYENSKVDMSKVASPPYDVISDAQRDELYRRDPNNIVRVEHPKPEREDLSGEEKYGRAKTSLEEMISKGILTQEAGPAFYLYEQITRHPDTRKRYSRLGLFCLLKLEELDEGVVIPHEKTHRAAKEDRFKLLKETQTNTSPIFGLYEDPESLVSEIFDNEEGDLITEFMDDTGDRHRLIRLSDEKRIEQIQNILKDKKIVIADGHHRYETALNYRRHVERLGTKKPEDDYTLVCLVEWDEPGLIILPIHRVIRSYGKMSRVEFLVRLKRDFILKEISLQHVPQVVKELERDFVIYLGGNYAYHAMLRDPEALKTELPEGKPEVWYDLTVNWFHHFVCDKILNLDDRQYEKTVGYSSSYKSAMTEVTAGTARAAFLFSATQKSEMKEIIDSNELMPQKSTFFYPKLLTGLVIYCHFEPTSFVRIRKEKSRDTKRGGRKIQIVPTVAAQMKHEEERKEEREKQKAESAAQEEAKKQAEELKAEEKKEEKKTQDTSDKTQEKEKEEKAEEKKEEVKEEKVEKVEKAEEKPKEETKAEEEKASKTSSKEKETE